MQVPSGQLALVYQTMHFAFCSEQCRERFQATPHLYVGVPGEKAVKQEGQELLKHRCFRLERTLSTEQARIVVDALTAMMGVKQVVIDDTGIRINYDLLEATAEQIERTLVETGTRLGEGWTERLRRALVHYAEDCEAENLQVSDHGHHHHM
jgi:YHS domain-containing protein